MTTRKFWCHYIGSDGNTPKRRSIELTSITELVPSVSNEGVKTPVWCERNEDGYHQVYYKLYAQLSDKVAVNILGATSFEHHYLRMAMTDEQIDADQQGWLERFLADYPNMSEERKQENRKHALHRAAEMKEQRDRNIGILKRFQDYDNYLLTGESWICQAAVNAYEEVQSPYLPVIQELRRQAMDERERREQERKEERRKAAEEEARKKAEAEQKEQERLTQEAEKFKQGESISGEDVVDLCRRYGIAIHLRTVHNLQQVIYVINGKTGTCQYYRQSKGKRRPQLDGCYKTAGELYQYLQTH